MTTPKGHDPIIYLFGDKNNSRCAIDATKRYNQGVGEAIRLKWDNSNYLLIGKNRLLFFNSDYGESPIFSVSSDYVEHMNTRLLPFTDPLTIENLQCFDAEITSLTGHMNSNGTRKSIQLYSSLEGNGKNLGWSQSKFYQVVADRLYGTVMNSSDINLKENVHYLNTKDDGDKLLIENVIETNDLYNFVKKDLKLTTYNYNEKYYGEIYDTQNVNTELGFIAQDLIGTKVENLVLRKDDSDNLAYNLNGYVSVLAGALQVAINKIETLETEINNLKNGGKQ